MKENVETVITKTRRSKVIDEENEENISNGTKRIYVKKLGKDVEVIKVEVIICLSLMSLLAVTLRFVKFRSLSRFNDQGNTIF